jgi:hypothetical protein
MIIGLLASTAYLSTALPPQPLPRPVASLQSSPSMLRAIRATDECEGTHERFKAHLRELIVSKIEGPSRPPV